MRTSQDSPSHSRTTVTRCPAERSMFAHRPAVSRLPVRLPGGAGVTMRMRDMASATLARMVADLQLSDLLEARKRASAIVEGLQGERLLGPKLAIVNPPLWEIGHVGWFQEYWCLRRKPDGSAG